jgi:hypothetical protein
MQARRCHPLVAKRIDRAERVDHAGADIVTFARERMSRAD